MTIDRILVAGLVTAITAITPAAALGKDGDVRKTGTCTKASSSKLKLSAEGSRIETEFEVDQNRNGVRWTITIRRDGTRVVSAKATTRAPSGSFSVRRLIASGAGRHVVSARAVSPSGEVCTARATFG